MNLKKILTASFVLSNTVLPLLYVPYPSAAQSTEKVITTVDIRPSVVSVMQGEPIPIIVGFPNSKGDDKATYTTDMSWCRFELYKGNALVKTVEPQRYSRSGFHTVPTFAQYSTGVTAKSFISGELTQVESGDYTLAIHTFHPKGSTNETRGQKLTFPFKVESADVTITKQRIARLRKQILNSTERQERNEKMRELSLMPASEAERTWRTLLLDPHVENRYELADVLSDAKSKEAVDTLLYVQFTKPLYDDRGRMLNLLILVEGIRMGATLELKQYISQEVAKRRGSIYYRSPPID